MRLEQEARAKAMQAELAELEHLKQEEARDRERLARI